MSLHPFTHAYLGLGLLDLGSIRHDGGTWTADYREGDDPYLRLTLAPDHCRVEEFDENLHTGWSSISSTRASG